jgi:hypothetical protein
LRRPAPRALDSDALKLSIDFNRNLARATRQRPRGFVPRRREYLWLHMNMKINCFARDTQNSQNTSFSRICTSHSVRTEHRSRQPQLGTSGAVRQREFRGSSCVKCAFSAKATAAHRAVPSCTSRHIKVNSATIRHTDFWKSSKQRIFATSSNQSSTNANAYAAANTQKSNTMAPAPLLSGAGGGIFFFHQLGTYAHLPIQLTRDKCNI